MAVSGATTPGGVQQDPNVKQPPPPPGTTAPGEGGQPPSGAEGAAPAGAPPGEDFGTLDGQVDQGEWGTMFQQEAGKMGINDQQKGFLLQQIRYNAANLGSAQADVVYSHRQAEGDHYTRSVESSLVHTETEARDTVREQIRTALQQGDVESLGRSFGGMLAGRPGGQPAGPSTRGPGAHAAHGEGAPGQQPGALFGQAQPGAMPGRTAGTTTQQPPVTGQPATGRLPPNLGQLPTDALRQLLAQSQPGSEQYKRVQEELGRRAAAEQGGAPEETAEAATAHAAAAGRGEKKEKVKKEGVERAEGEEGEGEEGQPSEGTPGRLAHRTGAPLRRFEMRDVREGIHHFAGEGGQHGEAHLEEHCRSVAYRVVTGGLATRMANPDLATADAVRMYGDEEGDREGSSGHRGSGGNPLDPSDAGRLADPGGRLAAAGWRVTEGPDGGELFINTRTGRVANPYQLGARDPALAGVVRDWSAGQVALRTGHRIGGWGFTPSGGLPGSYSAGARV